jgi:hypothetical protein
MSIRAVVVVLVPVLIAAALPATAQQPLTPADSTPAQLRTTLRAFYFSLAHRDWEALTADILPAKVVAHRPAPESLVMAARLPDRPARAAGSAPPADDPPACSSSASALVDRARITLDGDWAEVSVPSCGGTTPGADEFRFIHFEGRWRIVYIDLSR